MDIIRKYFPNLSDSQIKQFSELEAIYRYWNARINVLSRKDLDAFYERHVLHSLGIAKCFQFTQGTELLDLGTGGGFPGIPLAIFFSECHFTLVDSIGKKIRVVNELIQAIGLDNAETQHVRAEEMNRKFHFVLTRAVAPMSTLMYWTRQLYHNSSIGKVSNGLIALKGGDLSDELSMINKPVELFELSNYYDEAFFATKKIVYLNVQ